LDLIEDIKAGRQSSWSSPTIPQAPSIAVIPFWEAQSLPDQEHFADGMTEDLIAALSRFRWFLVADRNASFAFREASVEVQEVAAGLGVRYVVTGSIVRSAGRVGVSTELTEGKTGERLWADHYDRDVADIFDLQDEIVRSIVGVIEPTIGSAERARAARKLPASLDSWDCYHRGLWHFWKVTRCDFDIAGKLLQSACDRDPGFAAAHSARAYQLFSSVVIGWAADRERTLDQAWSAVRKALALDDSDAFAHMTLGRILTLWKHYGPAVEELEFAVSLNPYLALAHYGLGFALYRAGNAEGAILHVERAIKHSPFDPLRWRFEELAGEICFVLDRHDEAKAWLEGAKGNANSDFWPLLYLSAVEVEMGHVEEAELAIQNATRLEPELSIQMLSTAICDIDPTYKNRILKALSKVGSLPEVI
jgi:adenylate cyclase